MRYSSDNLILLRRARRDCSLRNENCVGWLTVRPLFVPVELIRPGRLRVACANPVRSLPEPATDAIGA